MTPPEAVSVTPADLDASSVEFRSTSLAYVSPAVLTALMFWQDAADRAAHRLGSLVGLAVSLGVAASSHYYAVLLWVPLACGEMVRWRARRHPDFSIVVALAAGVVPLVFWLPLM